VRARLSIETQPPIRRGPRHERLRALVQPVPEAAKQKHSGKLARSQVERLDREIAATDAEIDELVYELYGITDEAG
jgi:hypothetical protein